MRTVNIHAAKTQLSRLVEAAAAGEEVIIAKAGKPIARLCPLAAPPRDRVLGRLAENSWFPTISTIRSRMKRWPCSKAVDAHPARYAHSLWVLSTPERLDPIK